MLKVLPHKLQRAEKNLGLKSDIFRPPQEIFSVSQAVGTAFSSSERNANFCVLSVPSPKFLNPGKERFHNVKTIFKTKICDN